MKKIVVLISGNGSNLQHLIDHQNDSYCITKVISNKSTAYGLERAKIAGIATSIVLYKKGKDRQDYDKELISHIQDADIVVCAGFLRIVTTLVIEKYTIINLHPALSNGHVGLNCIEKSFNDFISNKINYSGVMVHHVAVVVDRGQLICEKVVPIYPWDTYDSFSNRIHSNERELLLKAVELCCNK